MHFVISEMESYSEVFEEDSRCTISNTPQYEDDFEHDVSIKLHHSENAEEYSTSDSSRQYSGYSKEDSNSDNGKSRQYSDDSQEYSTSDTVTSAQYSEGSKDYSTSSSMISRQFSEDSKYYSTSDTGASSKYSADSASYSNSDTTESLQYSDDFEEGSTFCKSADTDFSSVRYSDDFETVKTSIVDTIPEVTIFSDEERGREQSSDNTYSSRYQYSASSNEYSHSSRKYSEDPSSSIYTTESDTSRRHCSSDTSFTPSLTDHSTWADSSEYSEATSEATYLAEHNFINTILNRLKQQPSDGIVKKPTRMSREVTPQERSALKSKKAFCKKVIENLKTKENAKKARKNKQGDSTKLCLLGIENTDVVEDHGVSHLAINRLRLENTKNKYDKMIRAPIHRPDKCHYCIPLLELLAKDAFIKEKLNMAQESLIRDAVDRPCSLSTTLMMDPVILPGRLQNELSHLIPCDILAKIALRAGNKTQHPEHQITLDKVVDANTLGCVQSAVSRIQACPYIQTVGKNCTMIQDDISKKISQYIQNTEQQVDQVKQDLLDEMERLQSLSGEAFWKLYFSKLQQQNHLNSD